MRASELTNSKLVIFDIDDTLVNTDTKVGVVRDGRTIKRLDSHDLTHYRLQPGEEFDFGAFRDAREFFANARPIAPMIQQLKNDIATGNRVIMVTARADFNDRELFLDTFRKWGIDMSRVHVYRDGAGRPLELSDEPEYRSEPPPPAPEPPPPRPRGFMQRWKRLLMPDRKVAT